jgi:hypothetical protein
VLNKGLSRVQRVCRGVMWECVLCKKRRDRVEVEGSKVLSRVMLSRTVSVEQKIYLCGDAKAFWISGAATADKNMSKIQELLEAHSNKAFKTPSACSLTYSVCQPHCRKSSRSHLLAAP